MGWCQQLPKNLWEGTQGQSQAALMSGILFPFYVYRAQTVGLGLQSQRIALKGLFRNLDTTVAANEALSTSDISEVAELFIL